MSCGLLGFTWEERGTGMPTPKKSKTHFEQVPLEIVKKIAEEEIPDDEANGNDEIVETSRKRLSDVFGYRVNHGKRP
jgi:hypothetical protein